MSISYEPLWQTLQEKDINMTEMRKRTGIATATMAKLKKNESLTLAMIDKICNGLHCNIEDVVKIFLDNESTVSLSEMLKVSAVVKTALDDTRHRYGVITSIISPGRGIPTYYVLVPLYYKKGLGHPVSPDSVALSPIEINGDVFTPYVRFMQEFSVTEKDIIDIGDYISDEDMEMIKSAIYSTHFSEENDIP